MALAVNGSFFPADRRPPWLPPWEPWLGFRTARWLIAFKHHVAMWTRAISLSRSIMRSLALSLSLYTYMTVDMYAYIHKLIGEEERKKRCTYLQLACVCLGLTRQLYV